MFTGRLIEVLENAQDFITANELQAFVKEKVFSDARARNHEQTPSFGELFGTGDYVFVPSIERKVDDTRFKVAANANIPIPRQEAREFKLHFQNNILRPEIVGNFQTPKVFMISQAYVMDDATTKKYDLFAARFVDLGNGTLYDPKTKLIWSKEGTTKDISQYNAIAYIKRLNGQGYRGFRDWRLPTLGELRSLVSYAKEAGYGRSGKTIAVYLNREGFSNLQDLWYWTSTLKGSSSAWYISFQSGKEFSYNRGSVSDERVLPVRSGR